MNEWLNVWINKSMNESMKHFNEWFKESMKVIMVSDHVDTDPDPQIWDDADIDPVKWS